MGLRDRIKRRLRGALGTPSATPKAPRPTAPSTPSVTRPDAAARPPAKSAAPTRAAAPAKVPPPPRAETPPTATERPAIAPTQADSAPNDPAAPPTPPVGPFPVTPPAAPPPQKADDGDADSAATPTPEPNQNPKVSKLFVSDYATSDAPVRAAHYAGAFETTAAAHQITVHNPEDNVFITFSCEPDEYILDAAERAGHEMPYSCRSGGCLSCSAKVVSGDIDLGEQYVLEDEHIEAGFTLLCLTKARSNAHVISHQQDEIE